jgi:hypothetical protein
MLSSIIVSLGALIFLALFILYKRKLASQIMPERLAIETNQFQQQLQQTADTVIAQLEAKISELEALLETADSKIIELEVQLKAVDTIAMTSTRNSEPMLESYRTLHKPDGKRDLDQNAVSIFNNTDSVDKHNIDNTNIPEEDGKRQLVLAMAEQGYNITEIAKATGKGRGEIMLLLQLYKR